MTKTDDTNYVWNKALQFNLDKKRRASDQDPDAYPDRRAEGRDGIIIKKFDRREFNYDHHVPERRDKTDRRTNRSDRRIN